MRYEKAGTLARAWFALTDTSRETLTWCDRRNGDLMLGRPYARHGASRRMAILPELYEQQVRYHIL